MGLQVQGPRSLSPLEREAVDLVFEGSLDPCGDVYLTVFEHLGGDAGKHRGFGDIRISKQKFWRTDALKINSTSANTKILQPGNIQYLSTLIHECTHQWQWNYDRYLWSGPVNEIPYIFTLKELTELHPLKHKWDDERNPRYKEDPNNPNKKGILNLLKEQHASAAQVYFMIKWQLKYLPEGSNVNLSHRRAPKNPPPNYVGSAHRFDEIPKLDGDKDGQLFVSRGIAEDLADHFKWFLYELRSGGRWAG